MLIRLGQARAVRTNRSRLTVVGPASSILHYEFWGEPVEKFRFWRAIHWKGISTVKHWDGAAWVEKPVRVWNGSSWV